jgi:hypothetical protein
MALPSINFADIAPQGNPALANIIPLLVAGYKASQVPQQEAAANKHAQLLNALLSTQNQYLPQQLQGEIAGQGLRNTGQQISNQYLPQELQGRITGQNLRNEGQGITNRYLPQELQGQITGQSLRNAGIGIANQYAPQENQARINSLNAAGQVAKAKAEMGGGLSGQVGQAVQLQFIKNKFGENSPQYQQAQAAYTASLARYASPLTKLQRDKADIDAGFMPGSGRTQSVDPDKQNLLSNTYALAILKASSDAQTRQKALNAQNIDKTLEMINPKHLTQYAGFVGKIAKDKNAALTPVGGESKNYDNYMQALALTHRLVSQVRQFYGDSIMPSNVDKMLQEFDTGRAMSNPKLAQQTFNTLKRVLNTETGTYTSALKSKSPYEDLNASSKPSRNSNTSADEYNFNHKIGGIE